MSATDYAASLRRPDGVMPCTFSYEHKATVVVVGDLRAVYACDGCVGVAVLNVMRGEDLASCTVSEVWQPTT